MKMKLFLLCALLLAPLLATAVDESRFPRMLGPKLDRAQGLLDKQRHQEARVLLQELAAQLPEDASSVEAARLYHLLATSLSGLRSMEEAYEAALKAEEVLLSSAVEAPKLLAEIYLHLTKLMGHFESWEQASQYARQALALGRRIGDLQIQAQAHIKLADNFRATGDRLAALEMYRQGAELAGQGGFMEEMITARGLSATTSQIMGQSGLEIVSQLLDVAGREELSPLMKAKAQIYLGTVQFYRQEYELALDAFLSARDWLSGSEHHNWIGLVEGNIGETYMALEQWDRARFYLLSAMEHHGKANMVHWRLDSMMMLARIEASQGNTKAHRDWLEKVLATQNSTQSLKQQRLVAQAHEELAALTRGKEREVHQQQALAINKALGERLQQEKQSAERRVLALLQQEDAEDTLPRAEPNMAPWYGGLAAMGLLSTLLVMGMRRQSAQIERLNALSLRPFSELPHSKATTLALSRLLQKGHDMTLLFFSPDFNSEPYYGSGYLQGKDWQAALAATLRQQYPQALLVAEPDAFCYLVVLPGALEVDGLAERHGDIDARLRVVCPAVTGVRLAALNYPFFPHISRSPDPSLAIEFLLLSLHLARQLPAPGWLCLRPLPVVSDLLEDGPCRDRILEALDKGLITLSAGTPEPIRWFPPQEKP
ncbi:hypothetical protein [Gallaecimonas sp. GXIMD4217]|uniref:hypothetical protein n=1 Tax=Gallaecimonas sp. GXIMD4217 TaxID=3131927 RepID=UPI00311ADFE3